MTATIQSMKAAAYHADPCVAPSLSSSIAKLLVTRSPMHAYAAHPRLGNAARESASRSEIGSVAHKLALGAGADVTVIDADSYRTNAAKDARDAALAAGTIPILADDWTRADALARPLAEAAGAYLGMPIADCLREQVVIWQDGATGIWRRIMVDAMTPDFRRVLDLKTTEASVAPDSCVRRIYSDGYHVQAAFYMRGLDVLEPAGAGLRRFGFIFAEQHAPHAVSPPIELSEAGAELGRKLVERACRTFDACLASGEWPGYTREVYVGSPPAWELQMGMDSEEEGS